MLCKECTTKHQRLCSQHKECASQICGVRKERARRAHQSDNNSGETYRLLNTLEGELCRGTTKRQIRRELYRDLLGVHRAGASVHIRTLFQVQRETRRVSEENTHKVTKHSVETLSKV